MRTKDQSHSLTLAKGHSDFKLNLFFSETVELFERKFHEKAYWRMEKLIQMSWVINLDGRYANIYGKNI